MSFFKKYLLEKKHRFLIILCCIIAAAIFSAVILLEEPKSSLTTTTANTAVVDKYIEKWSEIEKGWQWADKHQMFQEVSAAEKSNDYIFRVHRILADTTQTTIIYTVEGENISDIYSRPDKIEVFFNGKDFNSSDSMRFDIFDGVLVGSIEFSDSIPQEKGTMEIIIKKIGNASGRWNVSFPVSRIALSELTKVISINESIEVPYGILTLENLVFSPAQTEVQLRYAGEQHAPRIEDYKLSTLKTPDEIIESRCGHGHGTRIDGNWEQTYNMEYQRLDKIPERIILKLAGWVYEKGTTEIVLEKGSIGTAPDGRKVYIENIRENGRKGQVKISYQIDKKNSRPFDTADWKVLDNKGELHAVDTINIPNEINFKAAEKNESEDIKYSVELEWKLPFNRKAVVLTNAGYWKFEDNINTFTIQIPEKKAKPAQGKVNIYDGDNLLLTTTLEDLRKNKEKIKEKYNIDF